MYTFTKYINISCVKKKPMCAIRLLKHAQVVVKMAWYGEARFKQDIECKYNGTLRRVCATIVAKEKQ
jgi:hypothetical protein